MATATIVIDELNTRYLVPDGDPATVAWIDRVLARVRHDTLESALAAAGLDPSARWCIERLDRRVVLDPTASDASNADRWAQDLVDAVGESLRAGRVVVYRSDHHLVADIVTGCLAGSLDRRWAWTQAGMVRAAWPTTPLALMATVADHHPTTMRSVLAAMVRRRPDLVDRIRFDTWVAVARSAVVPRPGGTEPQNGDTGHLAELVRGDTGALALARRLGDSLAWRHGAGEVAASNDTHGAVARLVLALADPSGRAGSTTATSAVAAVTAAVGVRTSPVPRPADVDTRKAEDRTPPPAADASHLDPGDIASSDLTDLIPGRAGDSDPLDPRHNPAPAFDGVSTDRLDGETTSSPEPPVASSAPTLEPVSAFTDHGGLALLWHLVDTLGLPDRARQPDHQLASRPLRWVLHRLGAQLTTLDGTPPPLDDDAGLLAFAGLAPDDQPPPGSPPTAEELVALVALSGEIAAFLDERFDSDGPTVAELCHRRAEVIADPGWIELHFGLDQVDLRVRRAGLDLDPGYVPWAGVVMRFVYE